MSLFLIAAGLHFVYTISHKTDAHCLATLRGSAAKVGWLHWYMCTYD